MPEERSATVLVELLRFVMRPATGTIVCTFRRADGSSIELEMAAECALHVRAVFGRGMAELAKAGAGTDPAAVPSVAVQGCKVMVNDAGQPALLFDAAGTSPFAVQLCQKSATMLIGELTAALNTQPPPGKRH